MQFYRKGENVTEEPTRASIPIESLPADFLWMIVKGGTSIDNVINHAVPLFESGEKDVVVWSGYGGGVGKCITCVEKMKRKMPALHQVTRFGTQQSEEYWDPIHAEMDRIVAKRQTPSIHIMLSKNEITADTPGHQVGQSAFWIGKHANDFATEQKTTNVKQRKRKNN